MLWSCFALEVSNSDKRNKLIEWVSRLLYSYPHVFAAGKLLSRTFVENLPYDPPLIEYPPWVNAYPDEWRWYLTMYSSQTWKIIDTLSNRATLLDLDTASHPITWFLSILYTLSATVHSVGEPRTGSKCQQIQDFYNLVRKIVSSKSIFITGKRLKLNQIEISPILAVINFHYKVVTSSHSCWDDYDPRWYAAAVAYLYDEDDIEFVPLLQSNCKQCALTCVAHTFADRCLHPSFLSSTKEALEDLLRTMVSMI